MAKIVGGIGCSHVPSVGAASDYNKTKDGVLGASF